MILFIHSFQVLNTLSCMVLTAVNANIGGHFNLVIGQLVFRRRRLYRVFNTSNGNVFLKLLRVRRQTLIGDI